MGVGMGVGSTAVVRPAGAFYWGVDTDIWAFYRVVVAVVVVVDGEMVMVVEVVMVVAESEMVVVCMKT